MQTSHSAFFEGELTDHYRLVIGEHLAGDSSAKFFSHEVGVLELNRNPENYFAEVEQAAFTPAHVVPGIGFSPDKFLQGRLFVYGDAQRYRLGINYNQIPVNRAHCEVNDYSRDGFMRTDGNYGSRMGYTPNSYGEWEASPAYMERPLELSGAAWRWDPAEDPTDDPYKYPGLLYRVMNRNTTSRLAVCCVRILSATTIILLVAIIGYIAFRGLWKRERYVSDVLPSFSAGQQFVLSSPRESGLEHLSWFALREMAMTGSDLLSDRTVPSVPMTVILTPCLCA